MKQLQNEPLHIKKNNPGAYIVEMNRVQLKLTTTGTKH